jgi:hypothetical protein
VNIAFPKRFGRGEMHSCNLIADGEDGKITYADTQTDIIEPFPMINILRLR